LGAPVISADMKPLKRVISVGAARNSECVSPDSGIIASLLPRT
jgi:hypothetical protein